MQLAEQVRDRLPAVQLRMDPVRIFGEERGNLAGDIPVRGFSERLADILPELDGIIGEA